MDRQNIAHGNNNVQLISGCDIEDNNELMRMVLGTFNLDSAGYNISQGVPNQPSNPVNGFDGRDIQNEKSSSTSVDSHKRKKSGGRPKKTISMEELLECKGYTLLIAAKKLGISRSTLQRRVFEVAGYKTWPEFQQNITDSQPIHGKQRIQGEAAKVSINVEHKGKKIPFDLPLLAIWEALQKRIKDSLKLKARTYDIKYFDGKQDLSIICNESLESCLRRATGTPIVLKVVERTKSG